jgi:purine-cytosine permease-like protein
MIVGAAVSIFLFSNQAIYTGPLPKALPQLGDLTFLVGFVLSAVVYYLLNMRVRERQRATASP